jgi:hypothetical protein
MTKINQAMNQSITPTILAETRDFCAAAPVRRSAWHAATTNKETSQQRNIQTAILCLAEEKQATKLIVSFRVWFRCYCFFGFSLCLRFVLVYSVAG